MKKRVLIVFALATIVALVVSTSPVAAIANIHTGAVQGQSSSLNYNDSDSCSNSLSNISSQSSDDHSETRRVLPESITDNFSHDYTLTGNGAADILAVAFAQLGRNGGSLGYTYEWCAAFIGHCATLAGQSAAVPFATWVPTFRNALLEAGGEYTSDPQPGDICVIDWDGEGRNNHVEIVYAVSGSTISTIGGNTGGGSTLYTRKVAKHAPLSNNVITCIIRPNYSGSISAPPEAPQNVHTDKDLYSCNEYITFYWDASATATNYYVYMWKDGVELYLQDVGTNLSFTSAPTSAGNYRLIVRAGNSFGYSDGSAYVDFTVYDAPPETPQNVHTDKDLYSCNEYITFYWDASATATNYYVYMWKDGVELYLQDVGTNLSFTSTPTSAGNYQLIIRAGNSFGYSNGPACVDFTVYDTPPEAPTVTTNKPYYRLGEPVVVSWNDIANTEFYWFEVYDENHQLLIDERFDDITTTSYVVNNLSVGSYVVYVSPNNAFGFSTGECRFSVVDQLLGDANNDGELNAVDAMLIARHALGIITLDNAELLDINSDGLVNILDALAVIRMALGVY